MSSHQLLLPDLSCASQGTGPFFSHTQRLPRVTGPTPRAPSSSHRTSIITAKHFLLHKPARERERERRGRGEAEESREEEEERRGDNGSGRRGEQSRAEERRGEEIMALGGEERKRRGRGEERRA